MPELSIPINAKTSPLLSFACKSDRLSLITENFDRVTKKSPTISKPGNFCLHSLKIIATSIFYANPQHNL